MRKLLANAPADREWRRRGYLVMCRARPGVVYCGRYKYVTSVVAGMAWTTLAGAPSGCSEAIGASPVGEGGGGGWVVVVSVVLGLREESKFRRILGYQ